MHKPRRNFNIQCEYCKLKGHSKENYYQLIGYPADFKGRKKQVAKSVHFGGYILQNQNKGNYLGNRNTGHTVHGVTRPPGLGSYNNMTWYT